MCIMRDGSCSLKPTVRLFENSRTLEPKTLRTANVRHRGPVLLQYCTIKTHPSEAAEHLFIQFLYACRNRKRRPANLKNLPHRDHASRAWFLVAAAVADLAHRTLTAPA